MEAAEGLSTTCDVPSLEAAKVSCRAWLVVLLIMLMSYVSECRGETGCWETPKDGSAPRADLSVGRVVPARADMAAEKKYALSLSSCSPFKNQQTLFFEKRKFPKLHQQ